MHSEKSELLSFPSHVTGGLVFAGPMRRGCYLTMLQPLEHRYGRLVTALVYAASLCGDLFWTAAILNALGVVNNFIYILLSVQLS